MDRETPDRNVACIERVIGADWYDAPGRLFDYHNSRFRERNLTEERDQIVGCVWAADLFTIAREDDNAVSLGIADLSCDPDPALSAAKSEITEMLAAMSRGDLLSRSAEYFEACGHVAKATATRELESADVEAWSTRLADDLSKFSD
jgi:hypothetical protein